MYLVVATMKCNIMGKYGLWCLVKWVLILILSLTSFVLVSDKIFGQISELQL